MADNKRKSALLVVVGLALAVLLGLLGRSGAELGEPEGATADASADRGLVGRELHGATAGGDEGAPLGPPTTDDDGKGEEPSDAPKTGER